MRATRLCRDATDSCLQTRCNSSDYGNRRAGRL